MTKALRQHIRGLKRRSERWTAEKALVEGEKCIRELCESDWNVERIYFTENWSDRQFWTSLENGQHVEAMQVSAKDMDMMSSLKTPPGVLAVAHMPSSIHKAPPSDHMVLYLDHLADPGNVGTLVRVADWFGLSGVVASPSSADPFGPKAIQSAMGSTFPVPITVCDLASLPELMRSQVVGLDAGGVDLFANKESVRPTLLVVGSESHGLTSVVQEACHHVASIPGSGRAESLNASVAGAVAVSALIQQGLSHR